MTRPNQHTFPAGSNPKRTELTQQELDESTKGGEQMLQGLCAWVYTRMNSLRNEEGATAVEYGLFVALIAAVIVALVATLGGEIKTAFQTIVDKL